MALLRILLLSLVFLSAQASAGTCLGLVPTELTAYLSRLIEEKIITENHLEKILVQIKLAQKIEPLRNELGSPSVNVVHQPTLEVFLSDENLDRSALELWIENKLKSLGSVQVERFEISTESHNLNISKLVTIQADDPPKKKGDRKQLITRDFEMMNTPVTQGLWVSIMGENPSVFAEGPETVEWEIKGKKIRLQPQHPVENITYWSTLEFINRYNDSLKLPRPYDTSAVQFVSGTRAEDGTLRAQEDDRNLTYVKDPSKKVKGRIKVLAEHEDVYHAEGFRLPTTAEAGLLEILTMPFWTQPPLKGQTPLTATLNVFDERLATLIYDEYVYSLYYNVEQWAWNEFNSSSLGRRTNEGGKTSQRMIRGIYASDYSNAHQIQAELSNTNADYHGGKLGFRMVRTKWE